MPPDLPLLRARNLAAFDGVAHGFTTRQGGVSQGPRASLNLAMTEGENRAALEINWRRVATTLDPSFDEWDLALVSQVHGREVIEAATVTGPFETLGEADAVITAVPGVLVAVRTADCVPILLAGPGVVGAVHAGWRGTAADIVGAAVAAACSLANVQPADLSASIGPHIGGAAYEVGNEVVDGLRASGLSDEIFVRPGTRGKPHVDLGAAVRAQLRRAGVEDVEELEVCTMTDSQMFSYRRDGPQTGRLAGVIGLRR